MKKCLICLASVLCLTGIAFAATVEDDVVRATGVASTYRSAINEALVSALEQHDGITVNATEVNRISQDSVSSSTQANGALDDRSKLTLNDAITKDMKKWANGRIKSYTVVSDTVENGKYRVEVDVHFVGKYEVGLPEGNRRRMAVVDFRSSTGDTFRWYGQPESTAAWGATLAEKLNERLTQTRKFTMLDRKFDAEVNAELSRLSAANASKADSVRLNQKLGTDYLVAGSVKFFPVVAPGKNPLTGQPLPVTSQPFAEVMYRVLLAPTGQLKWSDTVRIDAIDFPASSVGMFAAVTADGAAKLIADGLMANILPFEIVGRNGVGELIVGEGGKSLAVGERFTVYVLGEEVTDTRTGEVLDQVETAVGDVEIVRVLAKISYAKVIGGDTSKMVRGAVLRRSVAPAAPAAAPTVPVTTTVQGTPTGGVVTPF